MQVAIICEVSSNQPVGIIGKDKHNIGFISDSNELNEILDYIIDKNVIELPYNENVNGNNLLRIQDFDIHSKQYFIALNYILPEKWKILGLTNYDEESIFEDDLQNIYNVLMEGNINE